MLREVISGNDSISPGNNKYMEQVINAIVALTEIRDQYTATHQKRVAFLSKSIAMELGVSEYRISGLYIAALVHDIGKVYVPQEILTKPGKINEYEYSIIKKHSEMGYTILSKIEFPWAISEFVLQHHERLDGSGYPSNLAGEDIHLEAMIIAVADVVESMSSHRPYRPALGINKALNEISRGRGVLYHPDIVDACLKVFREGKFVFEDT